MRRFTRLTLALFLTLAFLLGVAPRANADDDTPREWRITRYDARVDVGSDGLSTVRVEFDFHFGRSPGHGPFVTLPTQQRVEGNPDQWRMVDITLGEVTSPSGAPAETTP